MPSVADIDTLDLVRGGIAATLKEAVKFSSDDYSPAKVNPPAAFPGPHQTETIDSDGTLQITFKWWIVVAANHKSKQKDLDRALAAACRAIDAQPSLGLVGIRVSAQQNGWDDYGDVEIAGQLLWGAMLTIEVLA